jgi:hypothetical protein
MKRNQGVRELNAKTEFVRAQQSRELCEGFWRSVAVVVPSAFKWLSIAWLGTKAAQVLIAWTGEKTQADVKLHVLADALSEPQAGILLPWAVTIVVYRRERALKEKAIGRLGEVTRKYEQLSDPNRSSSKLPPSGQTNPRDMP